MRKIRSNSTRDFTGAIYRVVIEVVKSRNKVGTRIRGRK